ncbi:Rieske (2Fe-2S) protein [Catenulispora sp. NF23]|uniref:Rieske (2Fe-2S) protein n=1 Tax=Catenulispora pinistramenti TaxID=2705254 RepID=UPI001BA529D2|nr:Rieske (2Fe-2S) protein [Catenulispora pinistramenti]MBS2532975.1 Rieske (2Fe-2S) protein [Catenulispora pinistramenti]
MATVDLAATQTDDETACPAHSDGTGRRAFFGIAAAVGAVCAGCSSSKSSTASAGSTGTSTSAAGGGSSSSTSSVPGSSDSTSGSGSNSASGSTSASSSGSGGGGAALAAASSVPVGGGTILAAQKIVLTQPTAGTYKAFTAVCTHMGCIVGTVQNGLIVCPCHGSEYHIADGSVANGPAPTPLAAIPITVANGQITKA